MITRLTEPIAKALATIVTIGFIKEQGSTPGDYARTRFQYSENKMPEDYEQVQRILRDLGLNVEFTKSPSPEIMPLIIAKPQGPGPDPSMTVHDSYEDVRSLFNELDELSREANAAAGNHAPHGAYIGGVLTPGGRPQYEIIGPTNIVVYPPMFGHERADKIKHFNEMSEEVGRAISIIKTVKDERARAGINDPVAYEITDRISDEPGDLEDSLFGSIHGMILSMLRYPGLHGNSLHFEFAMGPNTTKVSSCVPCSMFMSSNGRPASSTHLGRGDHWNFPKPVYPDIERQISAWESKVIEWYHEGLTTLFNAGYLKDGDLAILRESITDKEKIPRMFLESLTFPGKFTGKIIDTLRR